MSTANFGPEAKEAIANLRALTHTQKDPIKIDNLFKDYFQTVGVNLPYKRFGFNTFVDFLRASGEFRIIAYQGEIGVTAIPCAQSAHIKQMVARQSTKKKRGPRNNHTFNRSSFSSNVSRNLRITPIRRINTNNNRSIQNSSQHQSRLVGANKQQQNYFSGGGDANNNCNQSTNRNIGNVNNFKQQNMLKPQPLMDIKIPFENLDLREHINGKNSVTQTQSNKIVSNNQTSRPILGQNGATNQNSSKETFNEYLNKKNPQLMTGQNLNYNNINNGVFLINRNEINQKNFKQKFEENERLKNIAPVSVPTENSNNKTSVQNRLKITFKNNINNDINNSTSSNESSREVTSMQSRVVGSPIIESSDQNYIGHSYQNETIKEPKLMPKIFNTEFQFNPNLNAVTSLAQYCTIRQLPKPNYDVLKPKFGGNSRIQCRVNINNIIYSTYPDDYSDTESAIEACSKIAIQDIKEIEHKHRVPICMDSDCELAWKIYQELKSNYPRGIFAKKFPDVFEKTFQQSLPDHWWTIIQDPNQFILESTAGDNFILFANTESESSEGTASNISEHEEDDYTITTQLNLPWDEKCWNLYITHCVSTSEIWARIVHKDYSEKLDSLLTDIDMNMLSDKKRPVSLIIRQFYLVCISECWLRVRLENIDKGTGKCLCFFVDFGDDDLVAMDQLYICDKKFLELPPQAIPFSLFGLEDFTENPVAKKYIDSMLLNKSLIAEIITKRESYEIKNNADDESDEFKSKIQIILYDTSSEEDINLNPLLLNKICDETPPPELKSTGVTNVNVTHINDNGEVYLQIRSSGLHYVEKLIHQLVQSKFKEDQHNVKPIDMKRSNLFLIKDNDDKRWYRGCLVDNDFNTDDKSFKIFYVDHGNIKNLPVTNIFRLESLSTALHQFPWQAIKTKLHNLPPMNSNVVARIRGLLRINYPAIVKLAVLSLDNSRNVVPQINAFVRIERNHSLCNVNDSIRMEHEISLSQNENELDYSQSSPDSGNSSSSSSSPSYKHPSNVLSEMTACIRNVSLISSSSNKKFIPKLSTNCWIPDVGQLFNVLVTVSSNPFNFLVQSYNDYPKYKDMMDDLQDYCKSNKEYIPSDMITVGEVYAVQKDNDIYYRAAVECVLPSDTACVLFCDCGDVAVVNNSAIKTLPIKFRTIPKQAMQAKIYGIKPVNGDWTADDSIRFRELTLGQKFASIVKHISVDNFDPKKSKVLELTLIDVSTDNDIYIEQILINEKRAIAH